MWLKQIKVITTFEPQSNAKYISVIYLYEICVLWRETEDTSVSATLITIFKNEQRSLYSDF